MSNIESTDFGQRSFKTLAWLWMTTVVWIRNYYKLRRLAFKISITRTCTWFLRSWYEWYMFFWWANLLICCWFLVLTAEVPAQRSLAAHFVHSAGLARPCGLADVAPKVWKTTLTSNSYCSRRWAIQSHSRLPFHSRQKSIRTDASSKLHSTQNWLHEHQFEPHGRCK